MLRRALKQPTVAAPAPAAAVTTVAATTTATETRRVKTVTNAGALHLSHTDRTPSVTPRPHVEHGAALPDLLLREHLLGQGGREGRNTSRCGHAARGTRR